MLSECMEKDGLCRKVDLCRVCSLKVLGSSVLWRKCGKQVRGRRKCGRSGGYLKIVKRICSKCVANFLTSHGTRINGML